MVDTDRPFLHAIQAVKITCIFMLAIPTPIASETIDETILKGDTDLSSFDAFHVNEDYTIDLKFDFDILMSLQQYNNFYRATLSDHNKRNIEESPSSRWPNATIYYEIDETIRHGTSTIRAALNHWQNYTCMKFVQKNKPTRVKFMSGKGCWSYIGYYEVVQPISLEDWCITKLTIAHEVGHAIGFHHEHTRPDRDSYVRIKENTFNKITSGVTSFGVPYDYLSIMHYGSLNVITTLDPAYQNRIGKGPGLSFGDIKQTSLMYNCAKLRANCQVKACPFNGFVFFKAFKGLPACRCFCDSGDMNDPLVPCSQITREVPGPNPVAASSPASEDPNPCFDLRPDCDSLKTKGLCKSELTLMNKQCTKTCGFCGKDKNLCMDFDPACEAMAASCKNDNLKELMNKLCRKTCKLCTDSSNMCDIQQSLSGSGSN